MKEITEFLSGDSSYEFRYSRQKIFYIFGLSSLKHPSWTGWGLLNFYYNMFEKDEVITNRFIKTCLTFNTLFEDFLVEEFWIPLKLSKVSKQKAFVILNSCIKTSLTEVTVRLFKLCNQRLIIGMSTSCISAIEDIDDSVFETLFTSLDNPFL